MLRIHRIKPLLRQFTLVLCLVLAGAVVAVWVRSYFASDRIRWSHLSESGDVLTSRRYQVFTGMGGVSFSSSFDRTSVPGFRNLLRQMRAAFAPVPSSHSVHPPRYPLRVTNDDSMPASLGFGWFFAPETTDNGATYKRRMGIAVPMWSIFSLTMFYPFGLYVAGVVRRQREDRIALGLCPRCGSAFKDGSERCPGCDRPMPAALVRHA